jgi:plasmid stabilization system protein ParE
VKNAIIFSSFASKEIDESFNWYESRSVGLGDRFVDVVDKAFAVLSENPIAFPKKKRNYRNMVIDTFPYIIVYEYNSLESSIYILHVFHTSRDPKYKYRNK